MNIIYGPYTRKDGRKHVILYEKGKRHTVSYPKYLVEQALGRELSPNETVDHINRDFTDDRLENLRVIDRRSHAKEDAKRVRLIEKPCVWCGEPTKIAPSQAARSVRDKKAWPFCSHSCSGRYGAELQNGRVQSLVDRNVKIEYKYHLAEKSEHGGIGRHQGLMN